LGSTSRSIYTKANDPAYQNVTGYTHRTGVCSFVSNISLDGSAAFAGDRHAEI
jgi:hypothetical protein